LEWIGALITAVRNAGPPIYAAVLIATLLLLLLPDHVVAQIGLDEFGKSYRMYIGIGLIASASLLSVHILSAWHLFCWNRWRRGVLTGLDCEHCMRLRKRKRSLWPIYSSRRQYAVRFGLQWSCTRLSCEGIAHRASTLSIPGGQFPFNLQPYARALLQKHPTLLD
jgi:hypothetical protein